MKLKDQSQFLDEQGEVPFVERIRGTLRYGASWYADVQAQDTVISRMQNTLGEEYTVLRNHTLPELEVTIPLILIGPTGLKVIYTSAAKGIYQAKGDQWRVMSSTSRKFQPANPNLVRRVMLLTRAVSRHLERLGVEQVPIEPVLVCTDPGIHVDTKSPSVRIVMADALDRYIVSMTKADPLISASDGPRIVNLLQSRPPKSEGEEAEISEEDRLLRQALQGGRAAEGEGQPVAFDLPYLGTVRVDFSTRQWAVLAGLFLINVIILIIFIIIVFQNPIR